MVSEDLTENFPRVACSQTPLKTVVPMHYTSVNAFTNQPDHSNSTGYGPASSMEHCLSWLIAPPISGPARPNMLEICGLSLQYLVPLD